MNKVLVIGCPGSGKSVFSAKLHEITDLPLYHLDRIYWNADKTTVSKEIFLNRLEEVLQTPQWILDGNYQSTMEQRIKACDTVIFLDYPTEVCLSGIRERKGKPRQDLPWIETEEDLEFTSFVQEFSHGNRPQILELLLRYGDKTVYIFQSRSEATAFLNGILTATNGEIREKSHT